MTPTRQTRTGKNGNCFAACLASILDLPLRAIPEFSLGVEDDETFYTRIAQFLAAHALYYVQISPDSKLLPVMFRNGTVYHTIEGISPRGGQHAVVGRNGKMVWDPHPQDGTGRGLAYVKNFGIIGYSGINIHE